MKVYERQKVFLEAVVVDYLSSLLFLDYILEGSNLETMREIILSIKSTNFLNFPLFYSVDHTWNRIPYRGEFTFLFMPQLVEEVEIMMHHLIPCMVHSFRE